MSNVIDLNKPDPMVWACNCGCTTHEIMSDNTSRCAACGEASELGSGWVDDYKWKKSPDGLRTWSDVQANGDENFVKSRVSRIAGDDDTRIIVAAKEDGVVHVWHQVGSDDHLEWVRERLGDALALIEKAQQ